MLTREQIETLLIFRIETIIRSCNENHIIHVEGQIRALLAVLTGEVPPLNSGPVKILRLAGIPVRVEGGKFFYDDEWLISRGFQMTVGEEVEDLRTRHPDYRHW
jgi:hypothetical protein